MKPFLLIFVPLYGLLLAVTFFTFTQPIPGNEPVPEWVRQEEAMKGLVSDALVSPGRWAGELTLLAGPAIWALIPTLIIGAAWRYRKQNNMVGGS